MFLLFTGSNYYPKGGADDFKQAYKTLELALADYKNHMKNYNLYEGEIDEKTFDIEDYEPCKWAHVFNTETFEKINCLTGEVVETYYSRLSKLS